jgi:5-methylcytosine-specific restriction endonuclease McrA
MHDVSILHHVCGTSQAKGLFTSLITKSEPTKTCKKCGDTKPVAAFAKKKAAKDGLQTNCRACGAEQNAAWLEANRERKRETCAAWYAANKERVLEVQAAYYVKNRDTKLEYSAAWAKTNADRRRATNAAWYAANKSRSNATSSAWREANKQRFREYQAAWLDANRERKRETDAAWARANPDNVRQRVAAWRKANPDRARAATEKWQKANPEAVRIHSHTRRARTEKNGGKLSRNITKLLMSEQAGKCACCLVDLSISGHHLDHFMPLALGGTNTDDNIQLLCKPCNSGKGAKHPLDWMATKGIFTP